MKNTFSIAEATDNNKLFKRDELVFITSSGKEKKMVGLSFGEKINQVRQRQREYLDNAGKLVNMSHKMSGLKGIEYGKVEKFILRTKKRNQQLLVEMAKFRVAAKLEEQDVIQDLPEYKAYMKAYMESEVHDNSKISVEEMVNHEMMQRIVEENPDFFSNFVRRALKQSTTDSLISFLKPVLEDHGFGVVDLVQVEK